MYYTGFWIMRLCLAGSRVKYIFSWKNNWILFLNRTWIRGAFILMILLGLTWTFGLFYMNEATVVMAYVFTVLNSLQGLFIFLFHIVKNEKVCETSLFFCFLIFFYFFFYIFFIWLRFVIFLLPLVEWFY